MRCAVRKKRLLPSLLTARLLFPAITHLPAIFPSLLPCAAGPSGRDSGRPAKRKKLYGEHKSYTDVSVGIKSGKYHQVRGGRLWVIGRYLF